MQGLSEKYPLNVGHMKTVSQVELIYFDKCTMELVLWLSSIDHYVDTMVQQSLFMVCRYELLLWLSTFVTDCLNVHMHVVHDLPVIVYMSWGCSTQLVQYSDVCMMTQG